MDLFMGLFIETGYSEEIAQWNYLNMTAGVEDYSSGGGGGRGKREEGMALPLIPSPVVTTVFGTITYSSKPPALKNPECPLTVSKAWISLVKFFS